MTKPHLNKTKPRAQYVFPDPRTINSHILTLLPTTPPNLTLSIGTTSLLPPTPDSLSENPNFLKILHSVLAQHAHQDASVISQAQAIASSAGSRLGSGGAFFPNQRHHGSKKGGGGGGGRAVVELDASGGAANIQGGAGGGGRGGYIHVYDHRNPPDYGRISYPEDIFGSLEVDSRGGFVDGNGRYQDSGTYRVVTREGW